MSLQDWMLTIQLADHVANLSRHADTLTERESRAFALLWTPPPHVQPDGQGIHVSDKNMFHPRNRHHDGSVVRRSTFTTKLPNYLVVITKLGKHRYFRCFLGVVCCACIMYMQNSPRCGYNPKNTFSKKKFTKKK